jgi:hypothetical protein
MKSSDIAKLAASVAAGSISYEMARKTLSLDGDISLLDSLLASGSGLIGGAIGGKVIETVMDETGLTNLIDETFGSFW